MSRTRLSPVLLAATITACAGDRTPTEPPPATPPTDGPRTSTAPAQPAWMPSRVVGFQYVGVGRAAAATATTAPRAQTPCSDAGSGAYEFEYRVPPASYLLMHADSIRLFWSFQERHYHPKGGSTTVHAVSDVFENDTPSMPSRVHTSRDSTDLRLHPNGIVRTFVPVAAPMLKRLALQGGTLRVLINATAQVALPPALCSREVAGVHAKIWVSTPPQLHIFD